MGLHRQHNLWPAPLTATISIQLQPAALNTCVKHAYPIPQHTQGQTRVAGGKALRPTAAPQHYHTPLPTATMSVGTIMVPVQGY